MGDLILNSARAHALAGQPDHVAATGQDFRILLQGHVLRCAWTLDQLMRGGIEDGELQRFRFDAEAYARFIRLSGQLLELIRSARLAPNIVLQARQDEALQRVLAGAMQPTPPARGKRRRKAS